MSHDRLLLFAVLTALAMATGCGGQPNLPQLGQVEGLVTLDGNPLPGVQITFIPEKGRSSTCVADDKGRYSAIYIGNVKGALIGHHKVMIGYFGDPDDKVANERLDSLPKIPLEYNIKSKLTAEIKLGRNVRDFELSSKP